MVDKNSLLKVESMFASDALRKLIVMESKGLSVLFSPRWRKVEFVSSFSIKIIARIFNKFAN